MLRGETKNACDCVVVGVGVLLRGSCFLRCVCISPMGPLGDWRALLFRLTHPHSLTHSLVHSSLSLYYYDALLFVEKECVSEKVREHSAPFLACCNE